MSLYLSGQCASFVAPPPPGIPLPGPESTLGMELLHHQLAMRDVDGEFVCSRCGLVNPSPDQPCVPLNADPADRQLGQDE